MDEDFPVQRNRDGRYELWVCKEAIPMTNSTGHYRVYEVSLAEGLARQRQAAAAADHGRQPAGRPTRTTCG